MAKAIVITPTTGSPEVIDAINSVANQTMEVDHLLICDGDQFKDKVESIAAQYPSVKTCYLPYNTGANGYYGHRIMSAFSHLVDHDYILFLDQDNWYEPTHVESMINTIETTGCQWAYSLRNIYSVDGEYLLKDDCESLGKWKAWTNTNMVDTNCYCIPREIAIKIASFWHSGWGEDRVIFNVLHHNFNNYECTGEYTINYRLGGNEGSVTKEFFERGNYIMAKEYNGNFPWSKEWKKV